MAGLSITTILTFGLPLLFFAFIGLLDLLQKFGYIQTEKQRLQGERIERIDKILSKWSEDELDVQLETVHKIIKGWADNPTTEKLEQCQKMAQQALNMVTQQTGLVTEANMDLDTVKGILRNIDVAVRKLDVQLPRDLIEQITYIYKAIKERSNEGRVERLIEKVNQVHSIVSSHDHAVKELKDLHPSVRFDQGEKPAHWCSAGDLTSVIGQVHCDVLEAVKSVNVSLQEVRTSERKEKGMELDHLLKLLDLLGTLLKRVESLHDNYQELYDLLSRD